MAPKVNQNTWHGPEDGFLDRTATMDKLPDDCILNVFDYLPRRDLLALKLVSKRFNSLTDRAFRSRIGQDLVKIKRLPSLKLQRYGSSIKAIRVQCDATDEIVAEICRLCPNLKELHFRRVFAETLSRPFLRQTLSRLRCLHIAKLANMPESPKLRSEFRAALECCLNLECLMLPGIGKHISNFDTLFQVVFPKLRHFTVNLDRSSANESFMGFLQANTSIDSLRVQNNRSEIDLSGMLQMKQLQILNLFSIETVNFQTTIPNLFQLQRLQSLRLYCVYKSDIFKSFFDSLHIFPSLKEIKIVWSAAHEEVIDINDQDLAKLKFLPNLETFNMDTYCSCSYTNVTLPGILDALKHCPALVTFSVSGFRQNYVPGIGILVDEEIYEKFWKTYKRIHKTIPQSEYRIDHCIWFSLGIIPNMIDLFDSLA